ncbi:MAG: hypothetical protein H6725_20190 [Sandaracinaceae bacterium]|nr:hypothetical protein [Sandaracinaceae bacterium]
MKPNLLLSLFLISCVASCGGSPPPVTDPMSVPCAPEDCGPAPGAPMHLCSDGRSQGGPTGECVRASATACEWQIRECPADRPCGGLTGAQCRAGEYCNFSLEATCGAADQTGVCRAIPSECDEDDAPVCGCDDETYANACEAAREGVAVGREGACPPTVASVGETCGTRGALPCAEGLFCNFPAAATCGRSDAPGTCAERPTECETRARRVCGCDGTTYTNACMANQAGVSVETTRPCRTR